MTDHLENDVFLAAWRSNDCCGVRAECGLKEVCNEGCYPGERVRRIQTGLV